MGSEVTGKETEAMSEERQLIDGKWMTEAETIEADAPVCTREEFELLASQVAEIHGFLSGVASALKSPMLAALLPPQLRNMIP